jgi:hypothetical protein
MHACQLEQERENGMRTPPSQARGTRRHGTVFYVAMSDREFCQQTNGCMSVSLGDHYHQHLTVWCCYCNVAIKGDTYREGTGQQVVGVPGTFPGCVRGTTCSTLCTPGDGSLLFLFSFLCLVLDQLYDASLVSMARDHAL